MVAERMVSVRREVLDEARVEAAALHSERIRDARRMAKVVPMIRFGRAMAEDVSAERALGIVQLEVERIARRCPDDAA